ncbi:uncharacterized protein LOC115885074 [Sitophilus oryzae]|uniref:Uncharacterized protein LOC115885074 n=1 Tax=Sitophilus oryzae TaxID=7048 RepID=A0A6J2Y798_SITOR|nr:uncharacterized protein LOC115885074 [Sitophilus oryzae]
MASFLTFAVALILAVNAANGLKCYSCNSKDSTACGWGLASFTYSTEECQSAGFLNALVGPKCYKIEAKDDQGNSYIARGCQNPPAFGCEAIAKTAGWLSGETYQSSCSTCETDKCNSATKLTGFTVFGLLLATLAFLF